MRITRLSLAGLGAWPDLELPELSAELNVFFAGPHGGKSTLARLVGKLLYGKADVSWQQPLGQPLPLAEGAVTVESAEGSFVLRRRQGANGSGRLTVASPAGTTVDANTVQHLLGDLSARHASQLFAVDFAAAPRAERLFGEPFARDFTASLRTEAPWGRPVEPLDRRRVDELIQQRNSIARQIERQMQIGRRESAVLDQETHELDERLTALRQQAQQIQDTLRRLDSRRTELSAQLRYFSLESITTTISPVDRQKNDHQWRELGDEIAHCRQALADLQSRSVALRSELAPLSPDGTADRVTGLADGRATLGVVERLLNDLEAEIAQWARSQPPGRPIEPEAHTRLTPLAGLLRQQVYTLCGHWSEQERSVRREQLLAESRQVARTQTDVSDRLELLLSRRETLVAEAQAANRPAVHFPQAPVAEHCRCEHHHTFVQSEQQLHCGDQLRRADGARRELSQLERERDGLSHKLTALGREISQTDGQWKRLQQERAGLIGGAMIDAKRAELDRLESILQQALGVRIHDPARTAEKLWRASDVLAQLTAGRLVQIRFAREDARATILDNRARSIALEALTPAEHDQLYVALTLALASALAARGIRLPLILDEPFLRQDASAAAIMAGVLEEFGRAGHQLLVLTEDRQARRAFDSFNVRLIDLDAARRARKTSSPSTPQVSTRLVRETVDGRQTLGLRLASGHGDGDIEAVFYLSTASSLDEFPVLGSGTGAAFARLGIHTVGELLAADPAEIARRLERRDIRGETVKLWQSHMSLLCHVPELTLNDAQVLTACGISSPVQLRESDAGRLWETVESFLASDAAERFAPVRRRYNRDQIADWIYAAGGVRKTKPSRKRSRRKVASTTQRRRKRE
jgi:hypothetical protein